MKKPYHPQCNLTEIKKALGARHVESTPASLPWLNRDLTSGFQWEHQHRPKQPTQTEHLVLY